jgi:acetylcholinesterase
MSEDCLYLNLWVPGTVLDSVGSNNRNGSATLFWIYGGGYMAGTSTLDIYDGDILAVTENVIVASVNYRVGVFGFFCLGIEHFPCNQALWDQALSLRWIKDNIENFGGDPDLVIFQKKTIQLFNCII